MHGDPPTLLRLRLPAPGEAPRPHPKAAHPPAVVAQVRHLVETTPCTFRDIAARTGVDNGTIARWAEKHGWTRPSGAFPRRGPSQRRHVPVPSGRALAQRLRIAAERLVREIEAAPAVDPAALAEALGLLERARAEQQVRRTRKRMPPPDPPAGEAQGTPDPKPALDPATRERVQETRRNGAYKAWATRWATQAELPTWMREGGGGPDAAEAYARRQRKREPEPDFPSPHLPHVTKPTFSFCKWDRRAAAIKGWKTRHARMAGREP